MNCKNEISISHFVYVLFSFNWISCFDSTDALAELSRIGCSPFQWIGQPTNALVKQVCELNWVAFIAIESLVGWLVGWLQGRGRQGARGHVRRLGYRVNPQGSCGSHCIVKHDLFRTYMLTHTVHKENKHIVLYCTLLSGTCRPPTASPSGWCSERPSTRRRICSPRPLAARLSEPESLPAVLLSCFSA